jgi:type VI secretion system secreted protein VgrG
MPSFEEGKYAIQYRLHAEDDPTQVLKNQKFRIYRQDGSITEGATDANGESSLLHMNELENAAIELIKGL